MRFQLTAGIFLLLQAQNIAAQQSVGGIITSSNTTDVTSFSASLASSSATTSDETDTFVGSSSTQSSVFTSELSIQQTSLTPVSSAANSTSETSFSSSSSSLSSSTMNTSTSASSSSSIIPNTRANISTLPSSTSQFSSLSTSSQSSTSASSTSTTSLSSPPASSTHFSLSSSTSALLSTYTSDGQVMVTQIYLTLTSTHTSFSTKASSHNTLSAKNKRIVIGVVVGVGVPVIILFCWLVYFFLIKGKKQTYIDSQGRVVIDIKRHRFVKYVWCDLFGFSFKNERTESGGSQRESGLKRRGSKSSSSNAGAGGVLGDGVMQMNDVRLERENALLKEQREKGFPTSDEYDNEKSSHSASNSLEPGRDIDGNVLGRNSVNTHRRMESVITGDGFDYLDEINAKKY